NLRGPSPLLEGPPALLVAGVVMSVAAPAPIGIRGDAAPGLAIETEAQVAGVFGQADWSAVPERRVDVPRPEGRRLDDVDVAVEHLEISVRHAPPPCAPAVGVTGDMDSRGDCDRVLSTWMGCDGLAVGYRGPASSHSARARSRSLTFWILPVLVMGNSSTTAMWRGILKLARRPRQCSITSRSVTVQPGSSCTNATGTSESRASGNPTTAAILIPAWFIRKASTSIGSTFSPPIFSMSL